MPDKRLIDANALKKRAMEMEIFQPYGGDGTCMAVPVISIDNAPTIDAVEVVRCRECKHSIAGVVSDDEKRMVRCTVFHDWIDRDGYCHRGAKMEAEADG